MNFLDHAVKIAQQVDPHLTSPNPRVGCVVVRDGEIVSEGVHERFGEPHAEVISLMGSGSGGGSESDPGSGSQIYLTLEPCDHFEGKKTPSCTDLLMEAKPQKVVIGCLDPRFEGRSVERLRKAGIEVEVVDHEGSRLLNTFFVQSFKQKRPYLTLKLAQSLDGKIHWDSDPGGDPDPISNKKSHTLVHHLRAQHRAILTTTETVRIDDPLLNVRLENFHRPFSDPDLIILGDRPVKKQAKIFSISSSPSGGGIEGGDREIHTFPNQNLKKTLEQCYEMGIDSILTECGAEMSTKLLQEGLVNEIILFTAPYIAGTGKNTFTEEMSLANFKIIETKELDGDMIIMLTKGCHVLNNSYNGRRLNPKK
jgi:diaminohydroxyphosphoribosylaminopyrimidine deaminase / 5-amino-6-(5-phosphoribosylamino)uracil reductase